MTIAVDCYKNGILLGSGTATAASANIASYTANLSRLLGTGRNVRWVATTGNNVGASWRSRVVLDGGATITIADACPFS